MRVEGHKASRSSQKDCRENAPTPPCLALYLNLRTRGYAAWERFKEVSDTTDNLKNCHLRPFVEQPHQRPQKVLRQFPTAANVEINKDFRGACNGLNCRNCIF